MDKILNRIVAITLIVGVAIVILTIISELILNIKIINQDNCLEINGSYYCEVK